MTIHAETDIRFNYNNSNQIIAVANTISASDASAGLQAQLYSTDGGATWHQTSLPPIADGRAHERNSDPCVDWTSDGTAWALTMGIALDASQKRIRSFRSIDSGANWTFDSIVSGDETAVDKPALWVDHSQASPFRDNIYALWDNQDVRPNVLFFARREGPAGAWQAPQPLSGPEVTGSSEGGDLKTNTAGDVFAFWGSGEGSASGDGTLWAAKLCGRRRQVRYTGPGWEDHQRREYPRACLLGPRRLCQHLRRRLPYRYAKFRLRRLGGYSWVVTRSRAAMSRLPPKPVFGSLARPTVASNGESRS